MNRIMEEIIQEVAIETCIKVSLKVGATDDQIVELLEEDYGLSESDAKEQLLKFKTNSASQ